MKKILLLLTMVTLLFTGCKKEDEKIPLTLNTTETELKSDKTYQLLVVGDASNSPKWSSDNDFVATVNDKGLVTAKHIGSTNIICKVDEKELKCKVTVSATYDLYVEPIVEFGASKETIKSKEKRTLEDERTNSLLYTDSKLKQLLYSFKNNKLIGCGAVLPLSTSSKELVDFLSERYNILGTDGEFFIWGTNSMNIGVTVASYGIAVLYIPNDESKSTTTQSFDYYAQYFNGDAVYSEAEQQDVVKQLQELVK